MTIQRIVSGNRTPVERYAQLFAQLYGLQGGGFAQVSNTKEQDPPLRASFTIERDRDRVLTRNAKLADATIQLRRSVRATGGDRQIGNALPAHTLMLELALDQPDWKDRARQFFLSHPNLKTLHVTGDFPPRRQDDLVQIADFTDRVLATPFEIANPGAPKKSVLPESLLETTFLQLRERFPSQFRTMEVRDFSVPSGWLALVTELCEQIDHGLGDADQAAFHWIQITRRCHGLTCCYRFHQPSPVLSQDTVEPFDWGHLGFVVMKRVRRTELRATATCELCGRPGQPHRRGIHRWLCDEHARPGWNPLFAYR